MVTKDELLAKWSEKTTYNKADLEKIYNEVLAEEKKNYPTEKAEDSEKQALALLRAKLKKEFLGNTVNKRMWIIAADRLSDFTGRRYANAKDMFAKNPEQAVTAGVTDESGTPVYPPTDKFRPGKPMPEHDYQKTVYGYYSTEGMFNVALKGQAAVEFNVSLIGKLIEMPIWINKNKTSKEITVGSFSKRPEAIRILDARAEDGQPIAVADLFPKIKTKQEFITKNGTYQPVLVKGIVIESRETENPDYSNIISLDATFPDGEFEDIITCWVEPAIPIDFADGSEVIVLGTCAERTDTDGNKSLQMNVCGVYTTDRTIKEKPAQILQPTPAAGKRIEPKKEEDDNAW